MRMPVSSSVNSGCRRMLPASFAFASLPFDVCAFWRDDQIADYERRVEAGMEWIADVVSLRVDGINHADDDVGAGRNCDGLRRTVIGSQRLRWRRGGRRVDYGFASSSVSRSEFPSAEYWNRPQAEGWWVAELRLTAAEPAAARYWKRCCRAAEAERRQLEAVAAWEMWPRVAGVREADVQHIFDGKCLRLNIDFEANGGGGAADTRLYLPGVGCSAITRRPDVGATGNCLRLLLMQENAHQMHYTQSLDRANHAFLNRRKPGLHR